MSEEMEPRSCPECNGTMKAIRMIDQQLLCHSPMVYSVPEDSINTWSKFPVRGTINAVMCDSCGLVKLYGAPNAE